MPKPPFDTVRTDCRPCVHHAYTVLGMLLFLLVMPWKTELDPYHCWCSEAQDKRAAIGIAETNVAEAKDRQRKIEQRERELQGKLQGQQRTVEQTTADTRQRVEGECIIALWSQDLIELSKIPTPWEGYRVAGVGRSCVFIPLLFARNCCRET